MIHEEDGWGEAGMVKLGGSSIAAIAAVNPDIIGGGDRLIDDEVPGNALQDWDADAIDNSTYQQGD